MRGFVTGNGRRRFTVVELAVYLNLFWMLWASVELSAADYTNEFLKIGMSPAVSSQGQAAVTSAYDAFTAFYNPAMLRHAPASAILVHSEFFNGFLKHDAAAVVYHGQRQSVSLIAVRAAVDDIADTRNALIDLNGNGQIDPGESLDPSKISYFGTQDYACILGYSSRFHAFDYGFNLKMIYRNLHATSGFGIGMDVGLAYRYRSWQLACMLRDLTTTLISWKSGATEYAYPQLVGGVAYAFQPWVAHENWKMNLECFGDWIMFTTDLGQAAMLNTSWVDMNLSWGLRMMVNDWLRFSWGFDSSQSDEKIKLSDYFQKSFTTGLGLKWKRWGLEYAFVRHLALQNTHQIGLVFHY